MSYTYEYPRPAVTVDIILITKEEHPKVLLIQRKNNPFMGYWAFPGGFLDMDEDIIEAAKRELYEETNIKNITLKQFKTYGEINRDPRGRTISVVYYTISEKLLAARAGDDANKAKWFCIDELPENLAFDHKNIFNEFINNIYNIGYTK